MHSQESHLQKPRRLPVPEFYHPDKTGSVWRVPYQERAKQASEWAAQQDISPAVADRDKLALVMIDVQNTFCLPDFELFVGGRSGRGAVEDSHRLCTFIYQNLDKITHITVTMDTHRAMQIFHPVYLVNALGEHPAPLTSVTHEDVLSGRWQFNANIAASLGITPEAGQAHLLHYTAELLRQKKYDLTIWPYHAMLGGIGHALVSAIEEAIFFHTVARQTQAEYVVKGEYADTENYSAIGPEVLTSSGGEVIAEKDGRFLNLLRSHQAVVIAGQAKSHCVAWTVDDLLAQIMAEDPSLAKKVYLLEDCTSPVVVPGVVDYTSAADEAYARFSRAGMHLVQSTQPLASWPGISLPSPLG